MFKSHVLFNRKKAILAIKQKSLPVPNYKGEIIFHLVAEIFILRCYPIKYFTVQDYFYYYS